MVPRPVLAFLVLALAVLLVVSCVLLGFQALLYQLGDPAAARVVMWVGVSSLLLLMIDLILLVGALGINALGNEPPRELPEE